MPAEAQQGGVESRFADVNDIRLHDLFAGRGEPVFLLVSFVTGWRLGRQTRGIIPASGRAKSVANQR